jgi:hypothetical protein
MFTSKSVTSNIKISKENYKEIEYDLEMEIEEADEKGVKNFNKIKERKV